jgi:hypothetical protein
MPMPVSQPDSIQNRESRIKKAVETCGYSF